MVHQKNVRHFIYLRHKHIPPLPSPLCWWLTKDINVSTQPRRPLFKSWWPTWLRFLVNLKKNPVYYKFTIWLRLEVSLNLVCVALSIVCLDVIPLWPLIFYIHFDVLFLVYVRLIAFSEFSFQTMSKSVNYSQNAQIKMFSQRFEQLI